MDINDLKYDRSELIKEVDALLEKENPTDQEVNEILEKQAQIKKLDKEINAEAKREEVEALRVARAASNGTGGVKVISEKEEKDLSEYSFVKAIRESAGGNLTGLENEMNEEARKESREFGKELSQKALGIPTLALKHIKSDLRAMSVGSASDGGNTVDTIKNGWIDALRDKTVLAQMGATFLSGLTSDIEFDRQTSEVTFNWAAENASASESTPQTDKITMAPNRLTGYSRLGIQLLNQSSYDIEMKVRNSIIYGQARAFDLAGLNGSGAAPEPEGILNTTGIGSVATGPLSWAKVVGLETEVAVDNADLGNLGYVFNAAVRGSLKTTEKFSGSNGVSLMDRNEVNGYRHGCTNLMPANTILYGNFASLLMGQWGGLEILVDPYTRSKEAQVDLVMHFWGDVAVEHPESFSSFVIS